MNEEHELDKPLGELHEAAISLAMRGLHDVALVVGAAHEQIQNWAINNDSGDLQQECDRLRKALVWIKTECSWAIKENKLADPYLFSRIAKQALAAKEQT